MMNIRFSRKQLCIPYALFLICFVILPLAVIVYYAFTDGSGRFTLENLLSFFTNGNTIGTLCYSLVIAAVVTAVCLLVAYPAAYVLARSGLKRGPVILMLFILPMWINFTLRITALKEILTVLEGNLSLHPFLNTVIGMTYDYLPFMILPVQAALERLPPSLLQASADLGARPRQTFRYVVLPLAIPGIAAGSIFTFSLTLGDFIVPQLVGPPGYFIGNMVYSQQGAIGNMPMAAAFTLVPIVLIALYLAFVKRLGAFDAL